MKLRSNLLVLLSLSLLPFSQSPAQTYSVLHTFTDSPDGRTALAGLLADGNTLYGTTVWGGASSNGTIFKINVDGTGYAVLFDFSFVPLPPAPSALRTNDTGANPWGQLILSGDTLYGTARNGGCSPPSPPSLPPFGYGTVFAIKTNGTGFQVLHHFDAQASFPEAGLLLDGQTLYGTSFGSSPGSSPYRGAVFKIGTDGLGFSVIKAFSSAGEGVNPHASLILDGNVLYGTASDGGGPNLGSLDADGTVFKVNTDGSGYTNLVVFYHGGLPLSRLLLHDGFLYGATASEATTGGTIFRLKNDGTAFTTLKTFQRTSRLDPSCPAAGLLLSGSTLFGTTKFGGINDLGTLFRMGTDGSAFSVLKSFGGVDGANPQGDLLLIGRSLLGTAVNVIFSLVIPPPSLQIVHQPDGVVVFWLDDGFDHTLQHSSSRTEQNWSDIPTLNWTNNSAGALTIGYKIPLEPQVPAQYFRLQ